MLVKSKSKRFANKAEETAWWEANEEAVADSFEEALKEGYAGPCTVGAPGIVADQFGNFRLSMCSASFFCVVRT